MYALTLGALHRSAHPAHQDVRQHPNDVELYDVECDALERNNLASDRAQNAKLLEAMNAKLNVLIDKEVGEDVGQMLPEASMAGGW